MLSVNSYKYVCGEPAKLVQGVKGGRRPKGAVRGNNGSYLVPDSKPRAILYGMDDEGVKREIDIAPTLRMIAYENGTMLYSSYAQAVCKDIVQTGKISFKNDRVDKGALDEIWARVIKR